MTKIDWTPAQQSAIEGQGGNLLVSAAAGSGKTAVLAQRVIHTITEGEHPVDADRLLVVTFSNAAAGEMRQRISKKLWELAEEKPGDPWLMRQQLLLDCAQISTIHSFCIGLLRANFHLLELPADFRIGDERELEVLRSETARMLVARRYDCGSEVFLDLVELLSSSRSDSKVEQNLKKLYDFLRNHPFYEEWLARIEKSYQEAEPLESSPWFPILMDYAADGVAYCQDVLTNAMRLMQTDEAILNAYGAAFTNDLAQVGRCREQLEYCDWDGCRRALGQVAFGPLGRLVGYQDEEKKKMFQDLRKEVKGIFGTLQDKLFLLTQQEYQTDQALLSPLVAELFGLVTEFDRELSAAKLQKKLLDFGDLEHYTLRLLYDSHDCVHTPSAAAVELRERYWEIMIDEYQDTNSTQEMIFKAITRERGNQFLVGDVKQSIYRFRQARPENFLEKKDAYTPYDGAAFPAKISLSANFRTRREATEVINFLFAMVMSKKIGEMEYGDEDALNAAGDYDYTKKIPVRLLLTDPALLAAEDAPLAEARVVAGEIKRLLDEQTLVNGKTGPHPVTPGDICILLRSRSKADRYMAELELLGVRSWSDRQEGFLATREVAPVVGYLKVLANPLLDLELSQVLCSYLYGFSSEMLAQLRLRRGESLFAALLRKEGEDKDCAAFLSDFRLLRREAVSRPATGVLELLYALTGAENRTLAMTQGETRRGNLRLLCEYAATYNSGGDFSGFLTHLYALDEFGCDLPSATVAAGNAVSIMSIHKSKGLEFPVVFLCDTAARFNQKDLAADVLMHPELGFACVVRDNRQMTQHRTVPLEAMAQEQRRAMLSEELRILYVAMTRAKERLYLTAADKNFARLRRAAATPLQGDKVSPWAARSATCYLDWLALSLCHHPDFPVGLLEREPIRFAPTPGQGALEVRVIIPEATQGAPVSGGGEPPAPDPAVVAVLRSAMHWDYPFAADTTTPVKISVTQLTHGTAVDKNYFTRRPKLLTQKSLTPAERGIAAHKFMQFANYAQAAENPTAEAARLTQQGFLSPEEGDNLDAAAIARFFAGEIGRRILAAPVVHREIRFMREFTPAELVKINPLYQIAGNTVVQGVADCVIVEGGAATLVDYKTDQVKSMGELSDRYAGQLALYSHILEGLLEVKITQKVLYSFALGQEIKVT